MATVPPGPVRPVRTTARQTRAQRTLGPVRSRRPLRCGHTATMHREPAVPTALPTAGGDVVVVAVTAVLLALSLLLLL